MPCLLLVILNSRVWRSFLDFGGLLPFLVLMTSLFWIVMSGPCVMVLSELRNARVCLLQCYALGRQSPWKKSRVQGQDSGIGSRYVYMGYIHHIVIDEGWWKHDNKGTGDSSMSNWVTFFSFKSQHVIPTPCSTGMPQGQEAVKAEDDQKLTPLSMASKQGSGRMAAVLAAAGFQARKHGKIVRERCMDA